MKPMQMRVPSLIWIINSVVTAKDRVLRWDEAKGFPMLYFQLRRMQEMIARMQAQMQMQMQSGEGDSSGHHV